MPALVYPTSDFQPFTKILSSEVNGKFNSIKTLLNTTKLDYQNIQTGGLHYDNMTITTSMQIVGTNSAGNMTTQPVILASQGGTGFAYTPSSLDVAKVVQVNQSGTALTLDVVPSGPSANLYSFYHIP